MTLALRYAVRSDVGLLREGNEDSAYAGPHLLAVADGMGGYEAGEVASAAVISTVAPLDRTVMPESELIDVLAAAVTTAKQTLRRIVESDPAVGSMGTTLTAMLWAEGSAAIVHIGDSRAYLLRDGDLYQITRDHTFVQALIDQGRIRPEDAATHPQRSLLLRALDGRTDADPDLSMLNAQVGDRYLICSDGLPVAVSDELILQAMADVPEPGDAVVKLIDLAIAGGAPDNVTCIVADVIDTDASEMPPTKAPVVAGAAATSADGYIDKTKPFNRPTGDAGVTQLGAGAPTGTQPEETEQAGEDAEPPARKRRWPVMTTLLVVFILLIAGGFLVGYQYVNSQYYVAGSNGKVTIFRGLNESLLGISLSSVHQTTNIPMSGLQTPDAQEIRQGFSGTLPQAQHFVANIRKNYQDCLAAYAAVRKWEAGKPKPQKKTFKIGGHTVTRTVTPPYRPKPSIPAACPPAPSS